MKQAVGYSSGRGATMHAFVSSRSGSLEVWVSGIDDLMPQRVTSLGDAKVIGNLSWTSDSSSVVYSARRKGRNGAWQTNIASGLTTALRESDTYSNWPQFSADVLPGLAQKRQNRLVALLPPMLGVVAFAGPHLLSVHGLYGGIGVQRDLL